MCLLLFAPPHDNPPSLAGEGDPIPSAQKQAHFPRTWRRGKEEEEGTRRRGRGKEPTPRVPREAMWGQLGPTIQLILPHVEEEDHHEWRAAATVARIYDERGGSPGSARGRPSICTSVTVIELYLAAPK
eukprot:scaffold4608_cov129-Isochrysis_galbana.AAC.2